MDFVDFDRVMDRASARGAEAPDLHDLAACLADLAKALSEVDRRMDRIHDFLPPDVRKSIDGAPFLDTFMAYRTLNVHVATLRGSADAYEPRAICL